MICLTQPELLSQETAEDVSFSAALDSVVLTLSLLFSKKNKKINYLRLTTYNTLTYCCPTVSLTASIVLICKSLWIKASSK